MAALRHGWDMPKCFRLVETSVIAENQSMSELVFEITQESDGGFTAEALGESIFTQSDTWEELRANVQEAVEAFYFDRPKPTSIRLHFVRDEVLAIA
jgi:hypothetical protein